MTRDEFLKKYLTVVGKDAAVDNHDEAFIKKYLTQVGCPGEGPVPPVPPEPVLVPWFLVQDEESWNEAYGDGEGPLAKYYETCPQEDLWNVTDDRAANYNDRVYTGTLDDEEIECDAQWEADGVQSVTIDSVKYYAAIFLDMEPRELPLFTDVELSESAEKTFVITKVEYSGDCQHCWKGTYNASGAQLPWAVLDFVEPAEGKVTITYDETDYQIAGEEFYKYKIVSIPVLTGVAKLPDTPEKALVKDNYTVTLLPKE
jgi:hypothetical protein